MLFKEENHEQQYKARAAVGSYEVDYLLNIGLNVFV